MQQATVEDKRKSVDPAQVKFYSSQIYLEQV